MPQLRSTQRRNRTTLRNPFPTVTTRQRRRRRRTDARQNNTIGVDAIPETTALDGEVRVSKDDKAMDDYDSGGLSPDKPPVAEDEGSTAPLPEKVSLFLFLPFFFVAFFMINIKENSPMDELLYDYRI